MEYTINKLAKLAGVSTRTLRYYDQIDLLKPEYLSPSGYRMYTTTQVDRLQQILFYREFEMNLDTIKSTLSAPSYNRKSVLKEHLFKLQEKQKQLNQLINTLNKTIKNEEGVLIMNNNEKFEGLKKELIDTNEQNFGKELRKSYGEENINQSNQKIRNLTQDQYKQMQLIEASIQKELEQAVLLKSNPESEVGLKIAQLHKDWLSFTWPKYTKEAHKGLSQLYLSDKRFTQYYDKSLDGCASFLATSINYYTSK